MKTAQNVVLILAVTLVAAVLFNLNKKPKAGPSFVHKTPQTMVTVTTAKKPDHIVLTASVSEISLPGQK